MATVIGGDAHLHVTRLTGPIDLAFIDADEGVTSIIWQTPAAAYPAARAPPLPTTWIW